MLPLIVGAVYKLFDKKMLSLADGANNKLFGLKMSQCFRAGRQAQVHRGRGSSPPFSFARQKMLI